MNIPMTFDDDLERLSMSFRAHARFLKRAAERFAFAG
jgi:hypothetical protein